MTVQVTIYFRDNTEIVHQAEDGLVGNEGGTMVGVKVGYDEYFYPIHSIRHILVEQPEKFHIHDAQGQHTHEPQPYSTSTAYPHWEVRTCGRTVRHPEHGWLMGRTSYTCPGHD